MKVNGQLHALALLLPRKEPWYLLDRRQNGFQSWFGCTGEEKYLCLCLESNPSYPDHNLVTVVTELPKVLGFIIN
jgi:hypothetical protein